MQVLGHYVNFVKSSARSHEDALAALELVADVVSSRVIGRESTVDSHEAVIEQLSSLTDAFMKLAGDAQNRSNALRERSVMMRANAASSRFLASIDACEEAAKRLAIDGPTRCVESEDGLHQPWMGWATEPTIGWLMGTDWLHPPGLSSVYSDPTAYCKALQQLTTMLTFYWGAGAIAPRCRHQQVGGGDAKCCNEPLLHLARGHAECTARLPNGSPCRSPAMFTCPRGNHADRVCAPCLKRSQLALMGSPGAKSFPSTDIYDAVIQGELVRREGHVYVLSELCSRRPPRDEPNWRTTYRLACPALVAICRLTISGEALLPSTRMFWAEVVNMVSGPGADEAQARKSGRMAVRLLGRSDISVLPRAADLNVGTRVCVIDLRVFAPEVVPVLATFADPQLPEQFGRMSFVQRLIGQGDPPQPMLIGDATCIPERIANAINRTEIQLVQRLPGEARARIIDQISLLAAKATLYGTQLDAFCNALQYSVHCTQGPPGTGKSYTGVQLIAALNIMRQTLIAHGQPVGPIIVLAYKNHALDEILLDVKSHSALNCNLPGSLIRCGKSEDERLWKHAEHFSAEEKTWEHALTERLNSLRQMRNFGRDLQDLSSHLMVNVPALQHGSVEARSQLLVWRPSKVSIVETAVGALCMSIDVMSAVLEAREDHDASTEASGTQGESWPDSKTAYRLLESACKASTSQTINRIPVRKLLACMERLRAEAEHWILPGEMSAASLLQAWLSGRDPPPRCIAIESSETPMMTNVRCFGIACKPGGFCFDLHACRSRGCDAQRTTEPSRGLVPFCEKHRCQATDNCPKEQLSSALFCEIHSCRACVHFHKENGQPILMADPHACVAHRCNVQGCIKLQDGPNCRYCNDHVCDACLGSHSTSVMPRVPGSKFCSQHQCTAQGCTNLRIQNTSALQTLCDAHACVVCTGIRKPLDPQMPRARLCFEHRCQYVHAFIGDESSSNLPCAQQRCGGSFFCADHSCKICLQLPSVVDVGAAFEPPPRNVCVKHRLCSFQYSSGARCVDIADGEHYCKLHELELSKRTCNSVATDSPAFEQICHGTTKKNKPCRTRGKAPIGKAFYCAAHADQAPESESEEESEQDTESEEEKEEAPQTGHSVEPTSWMKSFFSLGVSRQEELDLALALSASLTNSHPILPPLELMPPLRTPPPEPDPPELPVKDDHTQPSSSTSRVPSGLSVEASEVPSTSGILVADQDPFEATLEAHDTDFNRSTYLDPDELDLDDYESSASNEEQQRLREVLGECDVISEAGSDGAGSFSSVNVLEPDLDFKGTVEGQLLEELASAVLEWSWKMAVDHRWLAASKFVQKMSDIVNVLRGTLAIRSHFVHMLKLSPPAAWCVSVWQIKQSLSSMKRGRDALRRPPRRSRTPRSLVQLS